MCSVQGCLQISVEFSWKIVLNFEISPKIIFVQKACCVSFHLTRSAESAAVLSAITHFKAFSEDVWNA